MGFSDGNMGSLTLGNFLEKSCWQRLSRALMEGWSGDLQSRGKGSFLGEGLGRCGGVDQRQVGDGTPVSKVGEGEDEIGTES